MKWGLRLIAIKAEKKDRTKYLVLLESRDSECVQLEAHSGPIHLPVRF